MRNVCSLFAAKKDSVVFRSRARLDHHKFSDLDLALFGTESFFDSTGTDLQAVLIETSLPPRANVVVMYRVSAALTEKVLRDGILLWEGCGEFRRQRQEAG